MAENPNLDQWARPPGIAGRACAKKNIVGNGTTVVKSSPGMWHTFQVNTRQNGGTATVYDNTAGSGTVIAVIDTGLSNSNTNTLFFDVAFSTGLTVVTANAANHDCVVSFQ